MFRVEFIGNLGADAQRQTTDGREFVSFKLAHNDSYTKDGKEVSSTTWASCVLNIERGLKLLEYLVQGRRVFVRGRASLNVYSSRIDRCMKAGLQISVDELELLGGGEDMPRELVSLSNGVVHQVHKCYFISAEEAEKTGGMPNELTDVRGRRHFTCNDQGFLWEQQVVDDTTGTEPE